MRAERRSAPLMRRSAEPAPDNFRPGNLPAPLGGVTRTSHSFVPGGAAESRGLKIWQRFLDRDFCRWYNYRSVTDGGERRLAQGEAAIIAMSRQLVDPTGLP